MPSKPPELPPKPEVALALLESATSVYVHLDPRGQDVNVPSWFKKQPQLVLQVGLNMAVPIPDLDVGEEGISCTLSFNRRPEFCRIPWSAIYGLVGEDGRGMIWPESVPAEVAAAAEGRSPREVSRSKRPKLRLAEATPAEETAEGSGSPGRSEGPQRESDETAERTEASRNPAETENPEDSAETIEATAETIEAAAEGESRSSDPTSKGDTSSPTEEESPSKKGRSLPPYLRVVK